MLAPLLRLMRPGDWAKNVFVLPALVFSLPQALKDARVGDDILTPLLLATLGAVAAFGFTASGFYALNDVFDAEKDRRHPVKRNRPVAAGLVPAGTAVGFGIALILIGGAIGFATSLGLGVVLAIYALLQLAYNLRLKYLLFVDVTAVAIGFALRAAGGAVAISVQISIWLVLCVFFLCLFLGFVKRLCDIASAEAAGAAWRSPAGYQGRGEIEWLLTLSAVLAVVTYLMYALSDHTWVLFGARSYGFALMTPLVLLTIHRFYRRANMGLSDSPLAALREDPGVILSVLLFAAGTLVMLYVPGVEDVMRNVFLVTDHAVDS